MKLLIVSAGPGMKEVREKYGHAIDWISSVISSPNIEIDVTHTYKNEDFDESYYDGWIITGSSSSVRDNQEWITFLKNKIIHASINFIPVLGICFGHQIISEALGGKVTKNKKGWELGSYKIKVNNKGVFNPLFSDIDINDYFYFSHEDVVSKLPESAVELASNDMGVQSFSIKNQIFGVQFHPEFTSDITQEYVNIRYKRGMINHCNQVFESKTSYKIILNFIRLLRENK